MRRPSGYDWLPLDLDDDPVPGDPSQVDEEARRLSSVATTISDQISALKMIANDNVSIGQYADKIRSSATDLIGTLQKVHDRYQRVSTALTGWEPELTAAKAASLAALNEAEAPYKQLRTLQGQVMPSGPQLTDQQQQQVQAHSTAMQTAQQQLNDAKGKLAKAIQQRDSAASHYAGIIRSASDDSLTDSWWDRFKNFIAEWAWLIKDICTVLEIAAAVLAIIALFATGAGWLIAAFILTAIALAGRTLLASTGNGSWLDVALDAFALLTLGIGGGITGAGGLVGRAGATLKDAIEVGDTIVQQAREASIAGKAMSFFGKASEVFANVAGWMSKFKFLTPLTRMADSGGDIADDLVGFIGDYQDIARPLASAMVKDVEQESALARAAAGGEDLGNYVARMKILKEAFSSSPDITKLAGTFSTEVNQARSLIFGGAAFSVSSVAAGGIPVYLPDNWGAEKPDWQAWDIGPFDTAEEALTVPVDAIPRDVWHLLTGSRG